MKIYFDMDGTIADLYAKSTWLEELIAEKVEPYAEAKPMIAEADLLNLVAKGYELGIVSWTAKNGSKAYNKAVKIAKIEWLKANFPNVHFVEIHVVKYGTRKSSVVKEKNAILFDDEEPNRKEWKGKAYEPNKIKNF